MFCVHFFYFLLVYFSLNHSHVPFVQNLREDSFTLLFLLVWNLKPSEAAGKKHQYYVSPLRYKGKSNLSDGLENNRRVMGTLEVHSGGWSI